MRAIVNFSTTEYLRGQNRLWSTVAKHTTIPIITFRDLAEIGAPLHSENPYAFKVYAIEHARRLGFSKILWLDASVYLIQDIAPVFNWIDKKGFFLEDSGHQIGQWSNDRTLDYYGIAREEAMQMDMISSGFVGIDFKHGTGIEMFKLWKKAMLDGQFIGSWQDHRHDQTCLSIIAYKMGLDISPCGLFFGYVGEGYGAPKETTVCHLQGIR